MDEAPLAGLRVLDLSTGIAGGFCTKLLADLGARVVKLESPIGDPLRSWSASGAAIESGESGALFRFLNASKRSAVLDLALAEDRKRALALAARCDVVVEGAPPGSQQPPVLDFESIQRDAPGTSLVSISAFGRSGPWADRIATEFTLLAWCGSMSTRGTADRPPLAVGGRTGEWIAGLYAAIGALLAARRARQTGRGEHVDVSMLEAMTTSHSHFLALSAHLDGRGPAPLPIARHVEVPSVESTKDGYVGFTTNSLAQFSAFCELIGRPDWLEREDTSRADQRYRRHAEMDPPIAKALAAWTVSEVLERCAELRIPASPIGNGRDTPDFELCTARKIFVRSPDGGFIHPRAPFRFSGASLPPFGPAPGIGEHTSEVLAELEEIPAAAPSRPPATQSQAEGRLAGLRIVDFTSYWAGPLVGHISALMGADVIKLESIQRPDGTRMGSVYATGNDRPWERQPLFYGVNTCKRAITLNLKSEAGRGLFEELLAHADVLIENYSPRVLEGAGFGYEALQRINPGLIMLRMPAWGLDGPWRERPAFAQTMEQFTGMAWITGFSDGAPTCPRGPCDVIAGTHATLALLAALEHRERTGEGQLVEVPMVETALNVVAEQYVEYSAYGELLERDGNRGPTAAPQGVYPCGPPRAPEFASAPELELTEHWIALAIATDAQWDSLCAILGHPTWSRDPALRSERGRRTSPDRLDAELETAFAGRPQDDLVSELLAAGVPAAPVVQGRAVDENPQMRARGFFSAVDHPITGRNEIPGLPMTFSSRDAGWHRSPAPTLGEHNADVLRDVLDRSDEEIERFREDEVIGSRPIGR